MVDVGEVPHRDLVNIFHCPKVIVIFKYTIDIETLMAAKFVMNKYLHL